MNGQKELTGRHVLIMLLSAFAVVLGVNVYFVYVAVSTNNPREAANAYQVGLHYNDEIVAQKKQDALGWAYKAELADGHTVRIAFTDKAGAPVTGLAINGRIGRPAVDHYNQDITFAEAQPGVYTAATNELEAGGWIVSLTATKSASGGENVVYRVKERFKWQMPKP